MERHGITVKSRFVPLSKSGQTTRSLNWTVTLVKADAGRAITILSTRYSADETQCPAWRMLGDPDSPMRQAAISRQCETGWNGPGPILPEPPDVLRALVLGADVLQYGSFEPWAAATGHNPDSRRAEAVYRDHRELAMKLRGGIGKTALREVREIITSEKEQP